ncbi:hypothetical protein E2562_021169 [Oryza meyeriana var. granulata]|uniref:Uncharacterized protein n=1 Tax=Oryza meyeriana var. granulata TaxID=110450 RepID=A0A6G1DYS7_9ORYZ|nr:hypothetical protein E2562_021169 [Oryza meyeriana var. granulata]
MGRPAQSGGAAVPGAEGRPWRRGGEGPPARREPGGPPAWRGAGGRGGSRPWRRRGKGRKPAGARATERRGGSRHRRGGGRKARWFPARHGRGDAEGEAVPGTARPWRRGVGRPGNLRRRSLKWLRNGKVAIPAMMDRQRRDDETEDNDGDRVRWHGGNETKRYLSTHGEEPVRSLKGR